MHFFETVINNPLLHIHENTGQAANSANMTHHHLQAKQHSQRRYNMQSIILKPDLQKGSSPEREVDIPSARLHGHQRRGQHLCAGGSASPLCNVSFRSNGKHPCRSGCGRGGFLSEKTVGNRAGPL